METIIYVLLALIVGIAITYLYMRMRNEKMMSDFLRENDRLKVELDDARNDACDAKKACDEAQVAVKQTEGRNHELTHTIVRLESDIKMMEQRCAELQQRLEHAHATNETLANEGIKLREEYIALQSRCDATQEKLDEQKKEMEELHNHMLLQFKTMANEIMDEKSVSFRKMSGESLQVILDPFKQRIEEFKKQVSECYDNENRDRTTLQEQIRNLMAQNERMRSEADRLSSALRGSTKVQGNWGEMILQNILQQSGLREGEDYELQRSVDGDGDNKRPDAILHFPNHSDLIIDSKVSFTAYDNYMNATNDEERKIFAKEHLESIEKHINQLGSRRYQARHSQSAEFVIMFIPIESMFMLALDEARARQKNLWNDAYEQHVIIMTPTNLVVAVRLLQDMWQQNRLEANIRAIKSRAESLYNKFVSFAADIESMKRHFTQAIDSCDSAYKRLVGGRDNLVLQIEKMRSLGIEPSLPASNKIKKTWKLLLNEAGAVDNMTETEMQELTQIDEEEEI